MTPPCWKCWKIDNEVCTSSSCVKDGRIDGQQRRRRRRRRRKRKVWRKPEALRARKVVPCPSRMPVFSSSSNFSGQILTLARQSRGSVRRFFFSPRATSQIAVSLDCILWKYVAYARCAFFWYVETWGGGGGARRKGGGDF